MSVKRYQLNARIAAPFMRDGTFKFRLGYSAQGGKVIRASRRGPIVEVTNAPPAVVSTADVWAQGCIERFIAPQKTVRNGTLHNAGPLFVDVTSTTTPSDVDHDLDSIFAAHESTRSNP